MKGDGPVSRCVTTQQAGVVWDGCDSKGLVGLEDGSLSTEMRQRIR